MLKNGVSRAFTVAGFAAATVAAGAMFVPVDVSGTATGGFSGTTPGFSYAPGPLIDGPLQFEDISSQYVGDVGYYGISPVLDSGTFGMVTLTTPVSGTQVYSGSLAVDVTFVSPTNVHQIFVAAVDGSITGAIIHPVSRPATGGVTIAFNNAPIVFYYGPGDVDWFSIQLNTITFGPGGGTQAITGHGLTYAVAPSPAGALVFLVGALSRRKKRR
jgi:hypothetical protein